MSAFMVDREHIRYLVEAAFLLPAQHHGLRWVWDVDRGAGTYKRAELYPGAYAEASRVGQLLWAENLASVRYRYPDCTPDTLPGPIGETYVYGEHRPAFGQPRPDPVEVLKAIHCLDYQSCEHPQWEQSEAYAFLRALERCAIHALEGYEQAPWERRAAS